MQKVADPVKGNIDPAPKMARLDYCEAPLVAATLLGFFFTPQFGSIALLAGLGGILALLVLYWKTTFISITRGYLLLILPLWGLMSFFWSQHPDVTLRYALQALVTAIFGIRLAASPQKWRMLWFIYVTLFFYVLVSLAFGKYGQLGPGQETAFVGLNTSKNFLADTAAVNLIISVAILLKNLKVSRVFHFIAAFASILISAYVLVITKSAGALVGGLAAAGILSVLWVTNRTTISTKVAVAILCAIVAIPVLASYQIIDQFISNFAQDVFHKNSSLTGRAYLWYRAKFLIAERPWLGVGWGAFWVQGDLEPEALWRYLFVNARAGISFHNSYYDVLVDLGLIGLLSLLIGAISSLFGLLKRFFLESNEVVIICIAIFEYEFARSIIESSVTPVGFYLSTIVLYFAMGVAFQKDSTTALRPSPILRALPGGLRARGERRRQLRRTAPKITS